MEKIDFVVLWVDSTDPEWIASYNHYRPEKPIQDAARFRNWNIFRYWFRAVERYAPWVNKVFLVTNGKFPDWINENCEKLVLVKHSDFIPEKYLPTFNSNAIELHINKINALSEHFVYFNDDIFINAPVAPEYYFRRGLPCDYNRETILRYPRYNIEERFGLAFYFYFDMALVNNHFSRKETIRKAWWKWYGPHLWGSPLLTSLMLLRERHFEGFSLIHNEQPMLKSVLDEIWEKEAVCIESCCTRFREEISLNQYLIRYWQFASNRFYPAKRQSVAYHNYNGQIVAEVVKKLREEKVKSICINDSTYCSNEEYEFAAKAIHQAFEEKFPSKSMFEKN